MAIEKFTQQIRHLEKSLSDYTNPENKNGFLPRFVDWVVEKWETLEYYDIEYIDVGYDCSSHPKRTGKKLSDSIQYYWEFINAANGNTEATFCSGSGFRADTVESDLGYFFSDCVTDIFDQSLEKMGIVLPEEFAKEAESVSEFIYMEMACYKKYPVLRDLCEQIILGYNCHGWNREPYVCEMISDLDEAKQSDHRFAMMTLQDFKELKQCLQA